MKNTYSTILSKDVVFAKLLKEQGIVEPLTVSQGKTHFYLCRSIISQQLSTQVAKVIYERFLLLFDKPSVRPSDILTHSPETYRSIGLSQQKINYIYAVATFFKETPHLEKKFPKMSNEEIQATLTQIKGIGKWSTEMYLMFYLGREDVFSAGDLGIQKSMISLYNIQDNLSKKELEKKMEVIARSWSPFRTYACLHLWQWFDMKKNTK